MKKAISVSTMQGTFRALFVLLFAAAMPARQPNEPRLTPSGLDTSDWAQIRALYETHRHSAVLACGEYRARNPRQEWLTRFDGKGFTIRPDSGKWTWGLELAGHGDRPRVTAKDGRVAYEWSRHIEEWFVNDRRGLEHGFTIRSRPAGASGPLRLDLRIRGGLAAHVAADGRGVRFGDVLKYDGLTAFDADGRLLAARFHTDGQHLSIEVADGGARYPVTIDPIVQQAYLKASNTDSQDQFGFSADISGDTVVVSGFREDSNATGVGGNQSDNSAAASGAAYVFVRSGGTWTQQAYLKASNTGAGDLFGASVAISGDTIVVGAYGEDSNATGVGGNQADNSAVDSGAAYVFVRSGGAWTQQAYLKASNTGADDFFGSFVKLSGNTLVVGAWREDSNATGVNGNQADNSASNSGAAYVFVRNGVTWTQEAYLKASNTEADDQFGEAVAVSGDTIVVGARQEDSATTGTGGLGQNNNGATNSGAVYVFVRNGVTWTQQAYIKASNTGGLDNFGVSVAVSGDTLVVGADGEDSSGSPGDDSLLNAGAAYVLVRSGSTWLHQAYLKPSSAVGTNTRFGNSVAISGNTVAVAAWQEPNGVTLEGAVFVFTRSGVVWTPEQTLKSSNIGVSDRFGTRIAASGDTMVAGAYLEDSNATGVNGNQADNSATDSGAAYIFTGLGTGGGLIPITIQTSPPGLQVSIDGGPSVAAPQNLNWQEGSNHTIATASPQAAGADAQYVFVNWSDGGALSHSVVAPGAGATYTATFNTQYRLTNQASPAFGGSVTPPSGFYNAGTVNLTATPSGGYSFSNWTGPVGNATASSTTVNFTSPATVTANFTLNSAFSKVGIFRFGFFWLQDVDGNRAFNTPPDRAFAFGGIAGDVPIAGDWNGDGVTEVGIYRPVNGLFLLDFDGDRQFTAADKVYDLGVGTQPGDLPVVGDWNGSGTTKVGLFRQGFFWILDTNGNGVFQQGVDQTFAFGGVAGDQPVVGDWDGDGRSNLGLLRLGFFWILDQNGNGSIDNVNQANGDKAFAFGGLAGDVPVTGDWNGDGRTKVGVYRLGFFWVLDANGNTTFDGAGAGQDLAFPFGGLANDKPVVGKW